MSEQIHIFEADDVPPLLYLPDHGDTIETASKVFKLSTVTIRRKVKAHKIFYQSAKGGTTRIDLAALSMVLSQDWKALELFRGGVRNDERVVRHHRHVEALVSAWLADEREQEKRSRRVKA